MAHTRMISKPFLDDLLPSGRLASLTGLVREDPELFLAFRKEEKEGAAQEEYVNVYYRGHSLYKVKANKSKGKAEGRRAIRSYTVTFDFNHARYTKDFPGILKQLQTLGMQLPNRARGGKTGRVLALPKYVTDKNGKRTVYSPSNILSKTISGDGGTFWDESAGILKGLVDDFFRPPEAGKPAIDYFKAESQKLYQAHISLPEFAPYNMEQAEKKVYLEKQHQQKLLLCNRSSDDGLFIYDMEYTEPSREGLSGRFDMLAIESKHGRAAALWIIELKTTLSACDGKDSGIDAHRRDMADYLARPEKKKERLADAAEILGAYRTLFGIDVPDCSALGEHDMKAAFILSGEAVDTDKITAEDWVHRVRTDRDWTVTFQRGK